MVDALDDAEKLLARAKAAIKEATRPAQENRQWQSEMEARLRRMFFRASFHPKALKFYSPQDFPDRRPPYQPFPSGIDE